MTPPMAPRRPADGQQRAALRREGDGTRSQGLISPQSSPVLCSTRGGLILWCLRVQPESTSAHPRCRKQDLLSALGGGLPEVLRPSRAAQRTGGHRRVATRKVTGDLATRRGAGDPVTRAEWMTVLRWLPASPATQACSQLQRTHVCRSPSAGVCAHAQWVLPLRHSEEGAWPQFSSDSWGWS